MFYVVYFLVGLFSFQVYSNEYVPSDCSKQVWLEHCGTCDTERWKQTKSDCRKLLQFLGESTQAADEITSCKESCRMGDMVLSNEQILQFLKSTENINKDDNGDDNAKRRKKRKIRPFNKFPTQKWNRKIAFKIDNHFGEWEKSMLRLAIQMWERQTCLDFQEIPINQYLNDNHLIFIKIFDSACFSYVGKVSIVPQPIYLSSSCFNAAAVIAHEIGHALGLMHEHQRPDRDEYVNINFENINRGNEADFSKINSQFVEDLGIPYDYGSDMHYRSISFSMNGRTTIDTKDSRYQRTIGQRSQLSFLDIKIINLAYCQNICNKNEIAQKLLPKCTHGGYLDPNNCQKCRCADGLGGNTCNFVATPVVEQCGGRLYATNVNRIITSPGYNERGFYENGQECSWRIKTLDPNKKISVKFSGDFGLYCFVNCYHWVEIKYKKDFSLTGIRYCCQDLPTETIWSEGNEMVITMKAINHVTDHIYRRGFQLTFIADADECESNPCKNGGKCYDLQSNYRCECSSSQYKGKNCEIDGFTDNIKDICKNDNHCFSGGTCLSNNGKLQCLCPNSYFGDRCEFLDKEPAYPPFCRAIVDVAFLLDASTNVDEYDWPHTKSFVSSVIDSIDVYDTRTRISLATFTNKAKIYHTFDDSQQIDYINSKISSLELSHDRANCDLYPALYDLRTKMFNRNGKSNKRPGSVQIIVLLLARTCYSQLTLLKSEIGALKDLGIEILPKIIGKNFPIAELTLLSDKNDIETVNNFFELKQLSGALKELLCPRQKPLDIAIFIDSSSYITEAKYVLQQYFLMEFVKNFPIGQTKNLISVGKYSGHTFVSVYLRQTLHHRELAVKIEGLNRDHSNKSTNIYEVLQTISRVVFSKRQGGRGFTSKIVLLYNNGPVTDLTQIENVKKLAKELHTNTTILVIGLGTEINRDLLLSVAGSEKNAFFLNTFADMHTINKEVLNRIQEIIKTTDVVIDKDQQSSTTDDLKIIKSTSPSIPTTKVESTTKESTILLSDGEECKELSRNECNRKCGGCGIITIVYKCTKKEQVHREYRLQKSCNNNPCTKENICLVYSAGLFWMPCSECCYGYKKFDGVCVPI